MAFRKHMLPFFRSPVSHDTESIPKDRVGPRRCYRSVAYESSGFSRGERTHLRDAQRRSNARDGRSHSRSASRLHHTCAESVRARGRCVGTRRIDDDRSEKCGCGDRRRSGDAGVAARVGASRIEDQTREKASKSDESKDKTVARAIRDTIKYSQTIIDWSHPCPVFVSPAMSRPRSVRPGASAKCSRLRFSTSSSASAVFLSLSASSAWRGGRVCWKLPAA